MLYYIISLVSELALEFCPLSPPQHVLPFRELTSGCVLHFSKAFPYILLGLDEEKSSLKIVYNKPPEKHHRKRR